jgi:hypothetical protein
MPIYLKNNKLVYNKLKYNNNTINKNILSNHINIGTSNKLFGKNSSTDKLIYSLQDPYYNDIGKFIRNPTCWLNGVSNISCASPAQLSGYGWNLTAGTLITKKHILQAKHYTTSILPNSGTPFIFVDDNNNVIRRNLISYAYDNITDIAIGLLDSEVPSNIKIAKVLPINFTDYINTKIDNTYTISDGSTLNSISFWPSLYSIGLDQEEKAILKLWTNCGVISGGNPLTLFNSAINSTINSDSSYTAGKQPIPDPTRFYAWSEDIITGDSGNPVFIIIDNELVVLTTWWTPSNGPFITNRYSIVNSLIESLSPNQGYSLTPVDLASVYNKYA